MNLLGWLRQRQPQRHEVAGSGQNPDLIPALVVGVYGTVHTDIGDLDTAPPTKIDIDCEVVHFHFPLVGVPRATLRTFTFHFGITSATVPITPPVVLSGREGTVTVVMPMSLVDMTPSNRRVPA